MSTPMHLIHSFHASQSRAHMHLRQLPRFPCSPDSTHASTQSLQSPPPIRLCPIQDQRRSCVPLPIPRPANRAPCAVSLLCHPTQAQPPPQPQLPTYQLAQLPSWRTRRCMKRSNRSCFVALLPSHALVPVPFHLCVGKKTAPATSASAVVVAGSWTTAVLTSSAKRVEAMVRGQRRPRRKAGVWVAS